MFGYVTVCEPELKVKDLKKYRAYYCGLCRTLKEDYGFMGQMTLTYDMTFAVILLSSLYETIAKHEEHRCKVHPVKRQHMLRNEITSYAAAMNVLLAYYHMEDDWTDDRKVSSLMTKSLIQGKAKKIIEKYPRQSEIIRKSLKELGECEREKSMDIDRAAGDTGFIFAMEAPLRLIHRHLGGIPEGYLVKVFIPDVRVLGGHRVLGRSHIRHG